MGPCCFSVWVLLAIVFALTCDIASLLCCIFGQAIMLVNSMELDISSAHSCVEHLELDEANGSLNDYFKYALQRAWSKSFLVPPQERHSCRRRFGRAPAYGGCVSLCGFVVACHGAICLSSVACVTVSRCSPGLWMTYVASSARTHC